MDDNVSSAGALRYLGVDGAGKRPDMWWTAMPQCLCRPADAVHFLPLDESLTASSLPLVGERLLGSNTCTKLSFHGQVKVLNFRHDRP